jgi:subfamily B ATP-binding cassette protein HlyB/CyaB
MNSRDVDSLSDSKSTDHRGPKSDDDDVIQRDACSDLTEPVDTGLVCLLMLARFHGIAAEEEQIAHKFRSKRSGLTQSEVLLAAKNLGLSAKISSIVLERLSTTPLPAMAIDQNGRFVIVARAEKKDQIVTPDDTQARHSGDAKFRVLIHDPLVGRPEVITDQDFADRFTGKLILFTSRAAIAGDLARFDFSWFIPAVVKYRKLLFEVLLVSLVLQTFGLVTPLFFQVVTDKVLVHRGMSTLDVIVIGLLTVNVFDVILTSLRTYVFAHTTSRIDVELGAKLFRHLLNLPLAYFQARRVGDSVARIRELENIRSFLTGNAITVVLDLLFSVVFIGVMFFYSRKLTLIVVLSLPCYVLISAMVIPVLRERLQEKFNRGAENQAFLVETITGIDTVKALAVEPQWTRRWDQQLAAYVAASFRTVSLSSIAGGGISLIGKLVTALTMYFGAKQVIDGQLSIGQLIAFNMLSGNVAQPVMRLANLWTDFQQTGISMQRLGDILNSRSELANTKSALPPISGTICFENVSFRYRPEAQLALKEISLLVRPGEVIGIVGRSGSGKSTLTKLVQRLYVPEQGRVMVDGLDLALIEASSLRRQIGVVLQENMLFNCSIRENIALADPGAPLESVVKAAKLAGAHDFIVDLTEGYDTVVGEHGATLSGGQRQRIAIARALMSNPRVLIFDEATSALDYESERIIQDNMRSICQGRTVLIIAHRLSAVREANRIVVMEKGMIVEEGSHAELCALNEGIYRKLYTMQMG